MCGLSSIFLPDEVEKSQMYFVYIKISTQNQAEKMPSRRARRLIQRFRRKETGSTFMAAVIGWHERCGAFMAPHIRKKPCHATARHGGFRKAHVRRKEATMFCNGCNNNNNTLWLIILIIILFGGCNNGCGCGCNNNCGCGNCGCGNNCGDCGCNNGCC
jgi:hypothetical protein